MIPAVIILANVAVVFAYLAGATTDISAVLKPSEKRSRMFSYLTTVALALLVLILLKG